MTAWNDILNELAVGRGFENWEKLVGYYEQKGWRFRFGTVTAIAAEIYAQAKIQESKVEALPPQQRRMYDALSDEWKRTKEVCEQSETTSGKVDALLKALVRKGLVETKNHGPKLQYWKRKQIGI